VVANLLSNAIKFSQEDDQIVIRVAQEQDDAVLSVQDTGAGIPEEEPPRIFEPYQRGSNVTGRIEGRGLGLAGASAIVSQHDGTISVQSRVGHGSTFTVRLPLTTVARRSSLRPSSRLTHAWSVPHAAGNASSRFLS
jgi:signal transduction histidine kinase